MCLGLRLPFCAAAYRSLHGLMPVIWSPTTFLKSSYLSGLWNPVPDEIVTLLLIGNVSYHSIYSPCSVSQQNDCKEQLTTTRFRVQALRLGLAAWVLRIVLRPFSLGVIR